MQDGPVHDCRHMSRQRLHASADVARSFPSRRTSHLEHVDKDGAQCLNVCEVKLKQRLKEPTNKAENLSISSISRATLLAWFFIFTTAIPTAICHGEIEYMHKGDNHTACLFLEDDYNHSLFQVSRTC